MINLNATRLEKPILVWTYWILVLISAAGSLGAWPAHPFIAGFFFVCLLLLIYGGFVEPYFITVQRYRLPLAAEPQAWVRAAFLSDLHAGGAKKKPYYERVVKRVQSLKPDVILCGGDFVEEEAAPVADLEPLAKLRAPLGRYFILGNHDYSDDPDLIRQRFLAWGFTDATNRAFEFEKDGRELELLALEDSWFGHPNVALLKNRDITFRSKGKRLPRLLLIHQPDNLLDVEAGDADVIVTGHTHGGQVRLPFIGPLRRLPMYAPQWLDRGLKNWNGIPVVISQGLGESDVRARLFCPPQIVLMELGI